MVRNPMKYSISSQCQKWVRTGGGLCLRGPPAIMKASHHFFLLLRSHFKHYPILLPFNCLQGHHCSLHPTGLTTYFPSRSFQSAAVMVAMETIPHPQ